MASEDRIIDRGRGPELAGTRVTVYRVMDFLRCNYPVSSIALELSLSEQQMDVILDYIEDHPGQVDLEYDQILDRVRRGNPPEIEALLPRTSDELRRRIIERCPDKR